MTRLAAGYIRVSGRGQLQGDGLPRQRRAIEGWAKKSGYQIAVWYVEEGVSGTLETRPALARLLVDLEKTHHDIKTIIVEKIDRLARDLLVQEAIVLSILRLGRTLVSATEGADLLTSDPTRKLTRQLLGALAEYDKSLTVQKLKVARERQREVLGRCEGRKPFGSRPGEEETIQRIRVLRRARQGVRRSYQVIADTLQKEGHLTRTGKAWTAGSVQAIVKRALPNLA